MDSKTVEAEKPTIKELIEDKELNLRITKLTPEQRSLYVRAKNLRTQELLRETGEHTYPTEERWELITTIESGKTEELVKELEAAKERESQEVKEERIVVASEPEEKLPIPDKLTKHKIPDEDFEMPIGGLPRGDRD